MLLAKTVCYSCQRSEYKNNYIIKIAPKFIISMPQPAKL